MCLTPPRCSGCFPKVREKTPSLSFKLLTVYDYMVHCQWDFTSLILRRGIVGYSVKMSELTVVNLSIQRVLSYSMLTQEELRSSLNNTDRSLNLLDDMDDP